MWTEVKVARAKRTKDSGERKTRAEQCFFLDEHKSLCCFDYQDTVQCQESKSRPGEQVQSITALAGV